ncbi:MAG: CAP domain-containing protein [Ruminiclostridium sp.]|nr:CAP domain-containing protein [Ruminiclostridium sp.]
MNTNEENKTEDRESGIQTYSRKKKSHGNFLKIGCASCGFVAVVALCVLSSRYSWFGVKADDEDISYNNGLASSYSTTAPVEEQKLPTKANKHNEAQETTVATSATTSVTTTAKTTQTTAATTKATAPATTKATAPATTKATTPATTAAPKPAWTEKKCSGTMYINISSCSARKEGLQGSKVVSYKYYGDAVNIAALTDTGYYKLDDGTYIHSDYLSESKPVATTVPATAKPAVQDNATPAPVITDSPVNCTAEEAEVFRIVNEIRISYGLKPYKWDANAYKAAKARCSEIEQQFSHLRPDGSNFKTIYGYSDDELWYKFCSVGENLGSGQPTAQRVVDSWMASTKGHRENILNPDFENLAVAFGTYNDAYKYYWVQEFTTYR